MRQPGFTAPLLLSALLAACAHQSAVPAQTPTPAAAPSPAKADPREGNVAVEFLADPDSPKPKLDESHEFAPASPRFIVLPEYPPAALPAGGPPVVVAVRLMIDEYGGVSKVKDSPRLAPYTGPFAAEFREAVETAVKVWSFSSARIDTLGPPHPDMPRRPMVSYRRVPTFLDFAFRFTVVDGKGVVTVGEETPVAAPSTPPERIK